MVGDQPHQTHRRRSGCSEYHFLIDQTRLEACHQVETCGTVAHAEPWGRCDEHLTERRAAHPVPTAHVPDMAIEFAARNEIMEAELLERGDAHTHMRDPEEVATKSLRYDQPCHAQRRGERLTRGTCVHNPVRGKPLQRSDRPSVVTKLTVVVVLNDPRVKLVRPLDEFAPTSRAHRDAGRILMRRSDHDRADAGGPQLINVDPLRVERHGNDLEPRESEQLDVEREHRVFHRNPLDTANSKYFREEAQPSTETSDDAQPRRSRDDRTGPSELVGEHTAEFGEPTRIRIPERGVWGGREHTTCGLQPSCSRKGTGVGLARAEVMQRSRSEQINFGFFGRLRLQPSDVGCAPLFCSQVPLGDELLIGAHDCRPRNTKVSSDRPRRRDPRPCHQPARPNCLSKGRFEGTSATDARVKRDVELHRDHNTDCTPESTTGLLQRCRTGLVEQTAHPYGRSHDRAITSPPDPAMSFELSPTLWTRIALGYLIVVSTQIGVWAVIAPQSFYDDFPGLGRTWVSIDGPFNEHLVRDVGALNLALTAVFVVAWWRVEKYLLIAAGAAALAWGLPHAIYHLANTDGLDTVDLLTSLSGLILFAVIGGGLLWAARTIGRAA